jgi:hypothetical protein
MSTYVEFIDYSRKIIDNITHLKNIYFKDLIGENNA